MRLLLIILLLLAPCIARAEPPAPILVQATFTSSTTAAVWWQQPPDVPGLTLTCIRIYHIGAEYAAGWCFNDLEAGPQRIDLPGELTHPAYRPAWGDRIVLAFGMDDVGSAVLGESEVHTVYLALVQRSTPPSHLTYLPALHF